MRRLRPLSEAECYLRCYGAGDECVRVIALERHLQPQAPLTGEQIRRLFEGRPDEHEPAEAA